MQFTFVKGFIFVSSSWRVHVLEVRNESRGGDSILDM